VNSPRKQRINAIDQFRGFAILAMVLVNFAADIQTVPAWFKHAPDFGLTFADLVAPMFIFAIGLTFGLSARRRSERDGMSATVGHFVRRFLALMGLGAIISAAETMLGLNTSGVDWNVLQSIGGAGLVTLTIIFLPTKARLGIGFSLLALYQILLNAFWLDWVLRSPHGGLAGTLSWSAMLILATVFGDLFQNEARRKHLPLAALLSLAAGIALAWIVPVSKNRVSASYDLITLGICGLIFSAFFLANMRLVPLSAWGQNPILLYNLHYLLIGLFVLPGIPVWHVQAPLWLAGLQVLTLLATLNAIAMYWYRKRFVFSL
jgi:predicted acyltransferase